MSLPLDAATRPVSLDPADQEVLKAAACWAEAGETVALVTVVRTWGASPRPPGALLAMTRSGRSAGSVSGGCVEDDLVARFVAGDLVPAPPTVVDYGSDPARAARLGLPCGGRLELVVEAVTDHAPLRQLMLRVAHGELVERRLDLASGAVTLHPGSPDGEFLWDETGVRRLFGPAWGLLLVGAEDVARHTARMARMLGYRVTVSDPREGRRESWDEPGVEFTPLMPDDAVAARADHPRAAVVTLAHDPRLDDMALMAALESRAFYVGALGSVRTSADRRRRLAELGLSPAAIARLHAPVGLAIGSRLPAEIAVSILAQVTAVRRGGAAAAPPREGV